jgi:hypothetical protein
MTAVPVAPGVLVVIVLVPLTTCVIVAVLPTVVMEGIGVVEVCVT